jgi:hypothetical protein
MCNTHDPLEEIHRAERAQEDDYFRKRDQELLVALREKSAAEIGGCTVNCVTGYLQ